LKHSVAFQASNSAMAPKAKPAATPGKAKAEAKSKPKKVKEEASPEDSIPKVAKPDPKEYETRLEAVQYDIEALQKKQTELNARISERSGGKDDYMTKRNELRAELEKWSGLMDDCKAKKDEIQKMLGDKRQENTEMRANLNKLKKTIGFTNETEIDDRIAEIEHRIQTDTMPLKEEKQLLTEIQVLRRNRPKVANVLKLEANIQMDDRTSYREQMKHLNEEMAALFEEKKKVSEQFKELNETRKQQTGDLPELIAQRDDFSKEIGENIRLRNEIRAEKRQAEQDFYAYQAELRKIKQDRAAEERNKRQQEYEERKRMREAEKLDDQPHVAEITLIEQTILYCKSLTQAKSVEQKEEKKSTVYDNPENTVVLKKDEAEEEFYFAPTKGKKNKSKTKNKGSETSGKPIKHNAETFNLFDKLKLNAPITTDDIPGLLEQLEVQLAEYKDKVKEWEVKREEMKRKILDGEPLDEEEKDTGGGEDEQAAENDEPEAEADE